MVVCGVVVKGYAAAWVDQEPDGWGMNIDVSEGPGGLQIHHLGSNLEPRNVGHHTGLHVVGYPMKRVKEYGHNWTVFSTQLFWLVHLCELTCLVDAIWWGLDQSLGLHNLHGLGASGVC